MNRKFISILTVAVLCCGQTSVLAEENDMSAEGREPKEKKEKKVEVDANGRKIKKGWNFGVLPCIGYDIDKGFQYGVLTNVYDYGDGSLYPGYRHSIYAEASWTTKNCGFFRMYYNSKFLIPNHWFAADVTYMPDSMTDFYGFNGFQSIYNAPWADSKNGGDDYLTRAFYKRKSNIFRAAFDFSGKIVGNLKWNAGLGVLGYMNSNVNLSKGNLPQNQTELYRLYKEWGLIKPEEDKGGWHPYIRTGLSFDSRDVVTNPNKGIFADAFVTYSAAFGDLSAYNNLVLNVDFRHYVSLVKGGRLNLAYRLCAQNVIAGHSPYYADNYFNVLEYTRNIYDALGGKNTFRGVLRNRILADGFLFASIELRSKIWFFDIGRQHFYIGLSPFFDAGMVTQPREVDELMVRTSFAVNKKNRETQSYIMRDKSIDEFFDFSSSSVYRPHFSAGLGIRAAMNENFVLAIDWCMPFDRQDNSKWANFYVGFGYLF